MKTLEIVLGSILAVCTVVVVLLGSVVLNDIPNILVLLGCIIAVLVYLLAWTSRKNGAEMNKNRREIFILDKRCRDYVIERGTAAKILKDIAKKYPLETADMERIDAHLHQMSRPPFGAEESKSA